MVAVAIPIDASGGLPAYTAQQTREAFSALTSAATATRPLGARTGVRSGTSTATAVMSGAGSTTWTLGAHSGFLDTETPVSAGPYLYATDGTDTGTITAADASNPRIDVLWVTVNDTVQDGSGLRSCVVGYSAGVAAGTPAAPTAGQGTPAVPARALILAQINVPRATTGSPTVSWVAPWTVASGGILPVTGTAQYPASPYNGQAIYDLSLGYLLIAFGGTFKKYETPRVGCLLTATGDSWATDGAVVSIGATSGAWTPRQDSGGFVTPGSTATPVTIPAGADGLYMITVQEITAAVTGLSRLWIQLAGTLPVTGTAASYRSNLQTGETNGSVSAIVPLAAGNTIGVQNALTTGATKTPTAMLSVFRVAA